MKDASERQRSELNAGFKKKPVPPRSEVTIARHLHEVVSAFIQSQQLRQTADYDNSRQWTRTEVLTQIDTVAAAFRSWKVIREEDIAQAYLVSLLGRDR